MKKKILVVDDSALMRSVLCDIINNDNRFQAEDRATNGLEALDMLCRNKYDAVVLDVNMPKMDGLQLLKELQKFKISARVLMASTDTYEGAKTTLDALQLGALDFVHKPDRSFQCRQEDFRAELLEKLAVVADAKSPVFTTMEKIKEETANTKKMVEIIQKSSVTTTDNKLVAIACSTGGPKALHSLIPMLPANLKAPVLIVQHMPKGFTASLSERLDNLSDIKVKEAAEGDVLEPGNVYLAMGGLHMNVRTAPGGKYTIYYSDEPTREGVKPCANYMYESLASSNYDQIVCVVMTGMGADGTKGIENLKTKKKVHVIAQDQETSAVYGMPKSVVAAGLADQVVPLKQIAQEIILNVGVM